MPGYSFIVNVESAEVVLPYEIAPGLTIGRADGAQIEKIVEILKTFRPRPGEAVIPTHHEFARVRALDRNGFTFVPRDMADRRYFVAMFDDNGEKIERLREAACVADEELEVGFDVIDTPPHAFGGLRYNAPRLWQSLAAATDFAFEPMTLSEAGLAGLSGLYRQAMDCAQPAQTALRDLLELKVVHPASRLFVLGLFGLIESLLAHEPEQHDRLTSIARQIRSKARLLSNRRRDWPNSADFFDGSSKEDPWPLLARLRNKIAHGGKPDYAAPLRELRNQGNATLFLRMVCKALIRSILEEPQFMTDLRAC